MNKIEEELKNLSYAKTINWIDCRIKMPEENQIVLLNKDGDIFIACYKKSDQYENGIFLLAKLIFNKEQYIDCNPRKCDFIPLELEWK